MNSTVDYGLTCLGWPPWSMRLSVLDRELSSYFLRLVVMTCHPYMAFDMELCLSVPYGTSLLFSMST